MEKQGTSSVFKRLFLIFLGLVIVVYAVIAVFFLRYVQQQRKIEMTGHITRVSTSASVIEQQIQAVTNVQVQLVNDTRIKRLSLGLYGDGYERSQLILDLVASIQTTQSMNSMIHDIVLLFPGECVSLSARGGYQRNEYDTAQFHAQSSSSTGQLSVADNMLQMKVAYPLKNSVDENYIPDYEVRIILSPQYLNGYLESFRHEDLEGAFWVFDNGQTRMPLFTDKSNELAMLMHWDEEWSKAGKPPSYTSQHMCEDGEYLFITKQLDMRSLTLFAYQDTNAMAWGLDSTLIHMAVIIVGMGLMFWLIIVWANSAVNKPIRKIMEAFEKVRIGDLDIRIFHKSNDEFAYIYDSFNDTVEMIDTLIDNVKEQKALLQNAELMQLQSQINPHFLYNSFYNIKFLAQNEECEQIETFVTALARYYRFINKETDMDVSLAAEVGHMENYIEIQQLRFGDKISVEKAELPDHVKNMSVPKLILQPIIENAYNYGLKDKLEGGLLRIEYQQQEQWLDIVIGDNGGAVTEEKLQQLRRQINTFEGDAANHAMTNINRRLQLSYGEEYGVKLDINEAGGLRVTLRLKISAV